MAQSSSLSSVAKSDSVPKSNNEVVKSIPGSTKNKQNLRILLAEDNSVNQRVACLILEKLGYRADVVSNGLEAVNSVQTVPYDCVLMDVEMPEMDGITATERILSQDRDLAKTPYIIALTAYALAEDRDRCLQAGMQDFITKPIRIEELERALDKIIALKEQDASSTNEREGDRQKDIATRSTIPPTTENESAEAEQSVLDLNVLNSLRQLAGAKAKELLTKIVSQYFEDSPARIKAIAQALETKDPEALRKAAHGFRSSSANLGAVKIADRCKDLENMARVGEVPEPEILTELEAEYAQAKVALQQECNHE